METGPHRAALRKRPKIDRSAYDIPMSSSSFCNEQETVRQEAVRQEAVRQEAVINPGHQAHCTRKRGINPGHQESTTRWTKGRMNRIDSPYEGKVEGWRIEIGTCTCLSGGKDRERDLHQSHWREGCK